MPIVKYRTINFGPVRANVIKDANTIITDYRRRGYVLTLRQLYYQFVARDLLPADWADKKTGSTNNERSYQKLSCIISDGRLAGQVDWHAIEDRTRNIDGNSHWDSPGDIIRSAAASFRLDKWDDQSHRVEVWVEKDALEGVVGGAAKACDIQFFSCRGYTSQTAMWDAGQRLKAYARKGQLPVILHLGDHDPSGIDMSRDIEERLRMFMDGHGDDLTFRRIALSMEQVQQYNPPPNPAKVTDSRFEAYQSQYGDESWELDALDPGVLDTLVRDTVAEYREDDKFQAREKQEAKQREGLEKAADRWPDVELYLEGGDDDDDAGDYEDEE